MPLSVRWWLSVPWTASWVNRLMPCRDAAASRYSGTAASTPGHPWTTAVNRQAATAAIAYRPAKVASRWPWPGRARCRSRSTSGGSGIGLAMAGSIPPAGRHGWTGDEAAAPSDSDGRVDACGAGAVAGSVVGGGSMPGMCGTGVPAVGTDLSSHPTTASHARRQPNRWSRAVPGPGRVAGSVDAVGGPVAEFARVAADLPVCGIAALQALGDNGELASGERVLGNGVSGVGGVAAAQIAQALGAAEGSASPQATTARHGQPQGTARPRDVRWERPIAALLATHVDPGAAGTPVPRRNGGATFLLTNGDGDLLDTEDHVEQLDRNARQEAGTRTGRVAGLSTVTAFMPASVIVSTWSHRGWPTSTDASACKARRNVSASCHSTALTSAGRTPGAANGAGDRP